MTAPLIILIAISILISIANYFVSKNNERLIQQLTKNVGIRFSEFLIANEAKIHAETLLQTIKAETIEEAKVVALQLLEDAKILAEKRLKEESFIQENTMAVMENTIAIDKNTNGGS